MNRIKKPLVLSVLVVALLFVFSACSKTKPTTRKLKGSWELVSMGGQPVGADEGLEFEFKSGGDMTFTGGANAGLTGEVSGTWSWEDEKTTIELRWNNDSSRAYLESVELTTDELTTKPFGGSGVWVFNKK